MLTSVFQGRRVRFLSSLAVLVALSVLSSPAHAGEISSAEVISLSTGEITGSSMLIRSRGGLAMTMDSSGVAPGTAVTIWWVILEETGCLITYAAGHVVGDDSSANFAGSVRTGEARPGEFGCEAPLQDPDTATVLLVVRSHGPMIPSEVEDQIRSFAGGCTVFLDPPDVPDAEGECGDIQFAEFLP